MCQVLGVARSGFYQWIHEPLSQRAIENERLLELIVTYSGDVESVAAYAAELALVEQQMRDLGLSTTIGPDELFTAAYDVPVITIGDIRSQSGSIYVSGDMLTGDGDLPIGVQLVARHNEDDRLLRTTRWLLEHLNSAS